MIKPAVFVQFILRLPIVKLMSRSRLGEGQVQVRSNKHFEILVSCSQSLCTRSAAVSLSLLLDLSVI